MTAVSRRDILVGAAAGSALAVAPGLRFMQPSVFLYDARLDAGGRIWAAAARSRSSILPVTSDIGRLVHDFDRVPLRSAATIAGLTTPATQFIFEQLALRRGMRVVQHGKHLWSTTVGRGSSLFGLRAFHTADAWPD